MPRATHKKKYRKKRNYKTRKSSSFSPADWKLAKRLELKTGVHCFKEKILDDVTITPNNAGHFFLATNFFFQDAPDYASYQRIFKAYQITGVKIKYIVSNPNSAATTTTDNLDATSTALTQYSSPSVCLIYSPTDSITPTSMADLLEAKGARLHRMSNGIVSKYIKPKPLVKLYNGSIDTDYKIPNNNKNTWIATNEVDLQHYALKEGWQGLNPQLTYTVRRIRTYYFKFKLPE